MRSRGREHGVRRRVARHAVVLGLPMLFALVGLFVAGSVLADAGPADDALSPLADVERSEVSSTAEGQTVRLAARTCEGLLRGSGFVVDGVLLTNAHLVVGADEVKVDRAVAAQLAPVMVREPGLDVAAIDVVGSSSGQGLQWSSVDPVPGTPVVLAGHPGGEAFGTTEAVVQLRDTGTPWGVDGDVLLIDAVTIGGFSGGPVLDRDGRVVAMLHGFDATTDLTVAIPADELIDWLEFGPTTTDSAPEC